MEFYHKDNSKLIRYVFCNQFVKLSKVFLVMQNIVKPGEINKIPCESVCQKLRYLSKEVVEKPIEYHSPLLRGLCSNYRFKNSTVALGFTSGIFRDIANTRAKWLKFLWETEEENTNEDNNACEKFHQFHLLVHGSNQTVSKANQQTSLDEEID